MCLGQDPLLARHLPLEADKMDLFEKSADGLIMCKLINLAQFDAIDLRAVNIKEKLNVYEKTENQNLVLNAARAIGCQVINIGSGDLIAGKPILVLGLVWQIIKIQLMSQISLRNVPELVLLLKEDETMSDFLKLHPEVVLLRWLNYHLEGAGSSRRVGNFGSDLADSEVYSIVLHQLETDRCPLINPLENPLARASKAIRYARSIGADVFLKPKDICDGNKKLNTSMVAQLFNTNHGLSINTPDSRRRSSMIDLSALNIDDAGDSREERTFRMWINSLNIEGVYVNDLFSETRDGVYLLKVIDTVQPGLVLPKRVNYEPKSRFKAVENCNYIVDLGKGALGFSLTNVGGLDILDGNKKLILAFMWQLMRMYTLKVLTTLALSQGITSVTDEVIVAWANEKVRASGRTSTMRSFKDSSLRSSIFLLELVSAIEARAVKWEV
ncbi:calponin homology domain-containing protein, partial [Ochromonadaceae sp. CCMP2298]